MRILFRFLLNALAVWLAAYIVPGVEVRGFTGVAVAVIAIALVNAFIRPILSLLTLPLQFLTLGLFTLILNALMFWLASAVAGIFGGGFVVNGFWAAFFGAIMTSVISTILSMVIPEPG